MVELLQRLLALLNGECPHVWEPRWIQILGEGETRWRECKYCGAKR